MKTFNLYTLIIDKNSNRLENELPEFDGENDTIEDIELVLLHPFNDHTILGKLYIEKIFISADYEHDYGSYYQPPETHIIINSVSCKAFFIDKEENMWDLDIEGQNYLDTFLHRHYTLEHS